MKIKTPNLIMILSVAGLMCLSAETAIAGSPHSVADLNNDGMVTTNEVVAYVQMNFSKIDSSSGQVLNAKEAAELEELFDIDG